VPAACAVRETYCPRDCSLVASTALHCAARLLSCLLPAPVERRVAPGTVVPPLIALLPVGHARAPRYWASYGSARRTTLEEGGHGAGAGTTSTSAREHCALIPSQQGSMSFINRYVAFLPAACRVGATIAAGSAAVLRPLLVGSDPTRVAPSWSKLASSVITFVRSTPSPAPRSSLSHLSSERR